MGLKVKTELIAQKNISLLLYIILYTEYWKRHPRVKEHRESLTEKKMIENITKYKKKKKKIPEKYNNC